ncbi:hypothetical protein AVEN_91118-1 [Araneus ventricosus]|uniref:DDE-1 domain-containing protein n=1 Tax=Araneus ventricosus TaxID=182803 RepID=A0A4Y2QGX2_ARAVE|nr:hypothetical protein AVEN_91118-1 [Araneus ventricosus]
MHIPILPRLFVPHFVALGPAVCPVERQHTFSFVISKDLVTFKRRYRKQLLSKLLFEVDDGEEAAACSIVQFWKALPLKDCVYMINEAWESVPELNLKRSWRKLAPYLENVDQSKDSGSVTVTELNGLLKQIPGCGNCEEDDVSSWLDCDADDAGFQLMSDDEIIAQVRNPIAMTITAKVMKMR